MASRSECGGILRNSAHRHIPPLSKMSVSMLGKVIHVDAFSSEVRIVTGCYYHPRQEGGRLLCMRLISR